MPTNLGATANGAANLRFGVGNYLVFRGLKASDITVQFCGIGWLPYIEDPQGNLRPA